MVLLVIFLALALLSCHGHAGESLNFMTIGDWGTANADQAKVALEMNHLAENHSSIEFIIALGDNFYDDGVSGIDDPQWETTFLNVFNLPSLKDIPWIAILGNHDYHQSNDAQIAYTSASSGKWQMDGHHFIRTYPEHSVKFIYTNSIWFAPKISKHTSISNPSEKYAKQRAWLEAELRSGAEEYDWLFVVGHYPLYSVGENGDQKVMKNALKDLLEKYDVDAYISAHDHLLQHLTKNGIEYFGSGAGCLRGEIASTSKADEIHFAKVEPGFTYHEINKNEMTVRFVSGLSGEVLHEFTQQKKNRSESFKALASNSATV